MRVSDILQGKGDAHVATIGEAAPVQEAIESLAAHNIGALLVMSGHAVIGIISERDVVRALVRFNDLAQLTVGELMTSPVRSCRPEDTLDEIMSMMTQHRIRHLPVMSHGELISIISIGDVVKHRMGELEFERDQLDLFVQTQAT